MAGYGGAGREAVGFRVPRLMRWGLEEIETMEEGWIGFSLIWPADQGNRLKTTLNSGFFVAAGKPT
jgi:hypothetical protein